MIPSEPTNGTPHHEKKTKKRKETLTGEKFASAYFNSVFFFISGFVCTSAGFGNTSCGGPVPAPAPAPFIGPPFATLGGGPPKDALCDVYVGGIGVPGGGVNCIPFPPCPCPTPPGVPPEIGGGIGVEPGIIGGVFIFSGGIFCCCCCCIFGGICMLGLGGILGFWKFGGGKPNGGAPPGGKGGKPGGN